MGLEGIGLGLPKVLLSPSPLLDPLPGDRSLPQVSGPGQALAAMLPGPHPQDTLVVCPLIQQDPLYRAGVAPFQ